MTSRISSLSLILVSLLGIGPGLLAQGESISPDVQASLRQQREAAGKKVGKEKDVSGDSWAQMTPEERLAAGVRRGSKAHCKFVPACRPPKLLPGQSGTLLVSAILQGKSVLPAPLQMTMTTQTPSDMVTLGGLVARPAENGVIAKAYLNRPVYENTAVFEVPITMGSAAKIGSKQTVAIDLKFDVYDGSTAAAVGRFYERVTVDVEVGQYLDPAVVGRSTVPDEQESPVESEVGRTIGVDAGPDAGTGGSNAISGSPVAVTDSTEQPAIPADDPVGLPVVPVGTTFNMIFVIGGGVILLLIALLLLRKK